MMSEDDNDGQMIVGILGVLKLPDICLTGEKTAPRKLVRTGDRTRARCVTGEHATARPTAVDPTPATSITKVQAQCERRGSLTRNFDTGLYAKVS